MEGKDHARIHTGRNDRNGRPRGSRRRTRWYTPAWLPSLEEEKNLGTEAHAERFNARQIDWEKEAEAGDQSLDGVHPRDEG